MEKRNANKKFVATLLVVITVLGYGLIVKAGNLEPSTGPGPTMKTLDEVEPRIIINSDNTPGDSSYEYRINSSGSYYLTGDVTTTKGGIQVDADNVTIDLMGYTLTGPDSGFSYGIRMNVCSNVEIRNGTIRDFGYHGIYSQDSTNTGLRVINVRLQSNNGWGIRLNGYGHLIKNCTAANNSGNGMYAEYDSLLINNVASHNGGAGIHCEDGCTLMGNVSGSNEANGFHTGQGCTIIGNTSRNNQNFGIYLGGDNYVDGNNFKGNNLSGSYANVNTCGTCVMGLNAL